MQVSIVFGANKGALDIRVGRIEESTPGKKTSTATAPQRGAGQRKIGYQDYYAPSKQSSSPSPSPSSARYNALSQAPVPAAPSKVVSIQPDVTYRELAHCRVVGPSNKIRSSLQSIRDDFKALKDARKQRKQKRREQSAGDYYLVPVQAAAAQSKSKRV